MNINCNNCEEDFKLEPKKQRAGLGAERVYFVCPHCGQEYTAYYTDKLIRQEQKNARRLIKKMQEAKTVEKRNDLQKAYEILKNKIADDMDALQTKIEESRITKG